MLRITPPALTCVIEFLASHKLVPRLSTFTTMTARERAASLAGREFLTESEEAALEKQINRGIRAKTLASRKGLSDRRSEGHSD